MKHNYAILFIFSLLFFMVTINSAHAENFKYENYSINLNPSAAGFSVIPTGKSSSVLNVSNIAVYETEPNATVVTQPMELLNDVVFHQNTTFSDSKSTSIFFFAQLSNGATIAVKYIHYKSESTVKIGNHGFAVNPDILHVRYYIYDWPFQSNNTILAINSLIMTPSSRGLTASIGGYKWHVNTDLVNASSQIIAESNDTVSSTDKNWNVATYSKSENYTNYMKNIASMDKISYDNFGISLLRGSLSVTDMIYTIQINSQGIVNDQLGIFVGLSLIGGSVASGLVYRKYHLPSTSLSKSANIPELFKSRSVLYYYLLGNIKINDEKIEEKLQEAIPHDLLSFKFLLDPVRLSITKLLFDNLGLTTVELKEILDIDWNKLNNSLTTLKDKGYIDSEHVFVDGTRKQVVTMLPYGIEQFKILTDLLHLFLDSTTEIEIEDYTIEDDSDLFPKK